MWSAPGRYALALALCAGACSRSGGTRDEDLAGLVTAVKKQDKKIDVAKAGRDSVELGRALDQSWAAATGGLGDHTLTIGHTVEVREGATVLETLGETTTLAIAKDGSYHATYENTADYGREIVFLAPAASLFLRPRYARWHRRAPEEPEEPAAIRDQLAAVLGADFDLVAHAAEVTDRGAATVAGRAGHRLEVKLNPRPKAAPKQALVQRGWREDAAVEALTGEVVIDDQTGAPLRATLDTTVAFVRDGKRMTMRLTLQQDTSAGAAAIAAPPDELVVATPARSREVDERNTLLEGIAPPVGKQAPAITPETPEPQPAGPDRPEKPEKPERPEQPVGKGPP